MIGKASLMRDPDGRLRLALTEATRLPVGGNPLEYQCRHTTKPYRSKWTARRAQSNRTGQSALQMRRRCNRAALQRCEKVARSAIKPRPPKDHSGNRLTGLHPPKGTSPGRAASATLRKGRNLACGQYYITSDGPR